MHHVESKNGFQFVRYQAGVAGEFAMWKTINNGIEEKNNKIGGQVYG